MPPRVVDVGSGPRRNSLKGCQGLGAGRPGVRLRTEDHTGPCDPSDPCQDQDIYVTARGIMVDPATGGVTSSNGLALSIQ